MSSSNSPCAACKFLRRKCTQECVFAPYFPPDKPVQFANVHRVFGASNVAKILNELPAVQREDAVNSLAYEADARLKDPVYGCVGLISLLEQRLKQVQTDLLVAKQELSTYTGPTVLPTPGYNPAAVLGGYNTMAHMMAGPSLGGGRRGAQLVIRDVEQQQQQYHQQQIQIQNAQQMIETQQLQEAMIRNWEQQQLMRFNAGGRAGGSGSGGGGGFCGTYEVGSGSNTQTMGVTPGDGFNQMDSPSLALGVSPGVGTSYDQNVTVSYTHPNVDNNEQIGRLLLLQQPEPPQPQQPVDVVQAAIPLFHHFHPLQPQHQQEIQQPIIHHQHNLEHEQEQHLRLDMNQLQHQDIHEHHHHQRSASDQEDMTTTQAPGPGF